MVGLYKLVGGIIVVNWFFGFLIILYNSWVKMGLRESRILFSWVKVMWCFKRLEIGGYRGIFVVLMLLLIFLFFMFKKFKKFL